MKCYICNRVLVKREKLADEKLEGVEHAEHIIPNSIRGKLKSKEMLCESCGNDLGNKIDSSFASYFSPITEMLRKKIISKDHGSNNASVNILGKLFNERFSEFDVKFKDGIISSAQPFYTVSDAKKRIDIYANTIVIKNYRHKVKQDEPIKYEDYEIVENTSISDQLFVPYFGHGILDLDKSIALGFIKIAVEYALSKGIKREQINSAITIDESQRGTLFYDRNVYPYHPNSGIETIFEIYRPLLEPNYITHTLILFTEVNNNGSYTLICYIDLFSTFQQYVVLSKNFESNFYKYYYQPIIQKELRDASTIEGDLEATVRDIIVRLKLIKEGKIENPMDQTLDNALSDLSTELNLEKEFDLLENYEMNHNMRKNDFLDFSDMNYLPLFRIRFFNSLSKRCESNLFFNNKYIFYDKGNAEKRQFEYSISKVSRLLEVVHIYNNF